MTTTATTSSVPDTTHSIFRSAARFFSGTMLSRVTGLLRDISMAYAFGTGSAIAAMLVAFRFAHLLRRLLGEGAMQTALVPHFEELRHSNPARAGRFFCDLSATLSLFLFVASGAIMGMLWALLQWGDLDPGNAEIVHLTLVMMPSLVFICLFGINASLLQCEKSYFIPAAAPIIFNVFWIAGVFYSSSYPSEQTMTVLSLFVVAGCFAQWAITLPKVHAILKSLDVHTFLFKARCFSADVKLLKTPLALGLIGVAASQVNNALDAVFARWADEGGPAVLWYAIRLQQLPLALFGIALAGALLPPLSRAAKAGDAPLFAHLLDFSSRRTVALMLPMTVALLLFGDMCIHIVYGHGGFDTGSTLDTTRALWGYSSGLVPMALVLIIAPAFYAKGNYRTPTIASVCAMAANIALNFCMVAVLDLGAASIAVATSLSAVVNLLWLTMSLEGRSYQGYLHAAKMMGACLMASAAALSLDALFWGNLPAWAIATGGIPAYAESFMMQGTRLVADCAVFFGVYGVLFLKNR